MTRQITASPEVVAEQLERAIEGLRNAADSFGYRGIAPQAALLRNLATDIETKLYGEQPKSYPDVVCEDVK